MFLAVLTGSNRLYIFEIILERKFNYTKKQFDEIVKNKTENNETLPEEFRVDIDGLKKEFAHVPRFNLTLKIEE